jgi:hypothetical protein
MASLVAIATPGIVLSLSDKEWCTNLVDVIEHRKEVRVE